jgi:hypothetical protein
MLVHYNLVRASAALERHRAANTIAGAKTGPHCALCRALGFSFDNRLNVSHNEGQ